MGLDNLEEYISLVVDSTVKTGIRPQIESFRAGFNQVLLLVISIWDGFAGRSNALGTLHVFVLEYSGGSLRSLNCPKYGSPGS